MLRILQHFASVCCAYGSNLLAYTAHTVTNCQLYCALLAMLRMRQQKQMAHISPICKKCKIFISSLKSPTYRDFMIKKSSKSKRSKSHTWAPFTSFGLPPSPLQHLFSIAALLSLAFYVSFFLVVLSSNHPALPNPILSFLFFVA